MSWFSTSFYAKWALFRILMRFHVTYMNKIAQGAVKEIKRPKKSEEMQ